MKNLEEELSNYTRLIKMIATHFGTRCEVVLHDLTKDYEHTIVAIENGHITGRTVGGCGSNIGLPVLDGKKSDEDVYNYITQSKDGRMLRSSTMFIKDSDGKVTGTVCINFDITDLMMADSIIKDMAMCANPPAETEQEIFANNVGEIIDHLLTQCQTMIGKPPAAMTKADKIRALEFFDSKGAFLITKAGNRICEFLGMSKFTLYNYLNTSRKGGQMEM